MKIEIIITDDAGTVVSYQEASPMSPIQYRPQNPEKPITDGKYLLHAYVYQPYVTLVPLNSTR